jgi:hypothetical protein
MILLIHEHVGCAVCVLQLFLWHSILEDCVHTERQPGNRTEMLQLGKTLSSSLLDMHAVLHEEHMPLLFCETRLPQFCYSISHSVGSMCVNVYLQLLMTLVN